MLFPPAAPLDCNQNAVRSTRNVAFAWHHPKQMAPAID